MPRQWCQDFTDILYNCILFKIYDSQVRRQGVDGESSLIRNIVVNELRRKSQRDRESLIEYMQTLKSQMAEQRRDDEIKELEITIEAYKVEIMNHQRTG